MVDEQFEAQVDAYVDEIWEDAVKDIAYLVAVESVEDLEHAAPGMPYGPAPAEAPAISSAWASSRWMPETPAS